MTKSEQKKPEVKPDPRTRRDELLEKALKTYLIPEGKVVLLSLIWRGVNEMGLLDLVDLCNSPLHEITAGLVSLRSAGINVWKGNDKIVLGEEWAQ
jgi:hypothetical protein